MALGRISYNFAVKLNDCFKDRLVKHFHRVIPLLSEPESSLIAQLQIDRDQVEVQDGWFWSFSAGSFKQGMIPESQARTFCMLFPYFSIEIFFPSGCVHNVLSDKRR